MLPVEIISGLHYFEPEIPLPNPSDFAFTQNQIPSLHFNTLFNNLSHQIPPPIGHDFTQQSSSLSNNSSTSDDAEEHHHLRVIDERKHRRMISNRESARRSRMRKQKHLDELWLQVVRLRNENHSLIDRLNNLSESHDRVVEENARLKEEACDLRQMLTNLQIGSPYNINASTFRELEGEVPCNTAHLRAESSNQSIAASADLLH
ncbi:basic leucine zipper 43-like [Pyrus x bretschneideri]|uniref:basic leucine zipper 43-like n=1 Tax=Pyrus x bretschneideri TaxID=225117 RepID=UPI00202F9F0D|nr:basic leucine zipper 43-like [Pyrus x bretschneideri]